MSRAAALLGSAAVLLASAAPVHAQDPVTVTVAPGTGAPRLDLGPVLDDEALHEAARSGLPLRLRFTAELWRDGWFDDLEDQHEWSAVLAYEPLERLYLAGESGAPLRRFASYDDARAALERPWTPPLGPRRPGRFYYLVTLEIETLSLSDLEELRRWLRGEVGPAVEGRASPESAVESGLRRVLVRVIGLPTRRMEGRSGTFTVR